MPSQSQEPPKAERERWTEGAELGQKYRLVRRLDEGGMGTVWVAHNADLDLHVALKLIRSDSDAAENADRLLKEARILARLEHPGIVRVFDAGRTPRGEPFIVMELLNGQSLADLLVRDERLPAARAVQLLLPLVEALEAAHELGVVHRDVKPENVFLAKLPGGRLQPKLLDFGIARIEQPQAARITSDGALLGSPAYMSPEQARGELEVDARADIWGLCVVLYELLTGRRPFSGTNYNSTLRAIIEQEPEPVHTFLAGDAELSSIIARGLKKERSERWPSMKALGSALAGWLLGRGIEEDVTRASLRSLWSIGEGDEAPWSVPPVALPSSAPSISLLEARRPQIGAPSSARGSSESVTMDELDASLVSELRTAPIGARSSERAQRGLSTNGHGAVSVTNGGLTRRSGAWLLIGAGALMLAGAIGWSALRRARFETPVSASGAVVTGAPGGRAPAVAPPRQIQTPTTAEAKSPAAPASVPAGSRLERAPARREQRSLEPARRARQLAAPPAAAEPAPKAASGEGSRFRPRGL